MSTPEQKILICHPVTSLSAKTIERLCEKWDKLPRPLTEEAEIVFQAIADQSFDVISTTIYTNRSQEEGQVDVEAVLK